MLPARGHLPGTAEGRLQPPRWDIIRGAVTVTARFNRRVSGTEVPGFDQRARPLAGQAQQDQPERHDERAAHKQLAAVLPAATRPAGQFLLAALTIRPRPAGTGATLQRASRTTPTITLTRRLALRPSAATPLGVRAGMTAVALCLPTANPALVGTVIGTGAVVESLQPLSHAYNPPKAWAATRCTTASTSMAAVSGMCRNNQPLSRP